MVEKADAGRDVANPGAVKPDGDLDFGLVGLARDGSAAHRSFSSKAVALARMAPVDSNMRAN